MFILKKNYTIAVAVSHSMGKWPEQLGNSFFTDSQYLIPDLLDAFSERIKENFIMLGHPQEHIDATTELVELVRYHYDVERQDEYAFMVLGKLNDREE